jgi:hypothetical protein
MGVKWRGGIYRIGKQRMSGPKGVSLHIVHQRSKGNIVRMGIIEGVFQK